VSKFITVRNDVGRMFNVRLLKKGDKYGLGNAITYGNSQPLVEFYEEEERESNNLYGRFIARYDVETIEERGGNLLVLNLGDTGCHVTGDNMKKIIGELL